MGSEINLWLDLPNFHARVDFYQPVSGDWFGTVVIRIHAHFYSIIACTATTFDKLLFWLDIACYGFQEFQDSLIHQNRSKFRSGWSGSGADLEQNSRSGAILEQNSGADLQILLQICSRWKSVQIWSRFVEDLEHYSYFFTWDTWGWWFSDACRCLQIIVDACRCL